jgi:hypothetical protein
VDYSGNILSGADSTEYFDWLETPEKGEGVVVMESITRIHLLARAVMWRKRMLALQDALAVGVIIAGLVSAGMILYLKAQALRTSVWLVIASAFILSCGALLLRWQMKREKENQAGFIIDRALALEDRFATAQAILEKGSPQNAIEEAQLDDAAKRIEAAQAAEIVPYRVKRFYVLSGVALATLIIALVIPQKSLPGGQAMAEMREEISAAGEELEKNSTEIEKFTPPETVTADLAREQAALGRELRNSNYDRADALKKLSSLEERIRTRHDELKSTRADEVVALAERRMRSVLSTIGKDKKPQAESEKEQTSVKTADVDSGDSQKPDAKATPNSPKSKNDVKDSQVATANKPAAQKKRPAEKKTSSDDAGKTQVAENQTAGNEAQNKPPKPDGASKGQTKDPEPAKPDSPVAKQNDSPEKKADSGQPGKPDAAQKPADPAKKDDNQVAKGEDKQPEKIDPELAKSLKDVEKETRPGQADSQTGKEQKDGEADNPESNNSLTGALAEQGTKALSSELMDKAKDLQAGKLSAEEIAKLGQSAAQLAKDLAPLAQSKAFQNALEQMAKQIDPQVLEQVARELQKNEQLKKELQAAAKLLVQNQQVKEMIAGFRKMGEEMARERGEDPKENLKQKEQALRNQQAEAQNQQITLNAKPEADTRGGTPGGYNQPGKGTQTARAEQARKLAGQGKETRFAGKLQERPGGDFVFTNAKPGSGAARVPYSNAYPQYRREAERTVERSRIPSQMRSMVRNYFDAINPDAKKSN